MAGSSTRVTGLQLELEFATECIKKGAVVSQPFGDNSHYDLLVDVKKKIYKVQVKTASPSESGKYYRVNITRKVPKMRPKDPGGSSKAVPYAADDIDCIVTKAEGIWFFFGPDQFDSDKSVYPAGGKDDYVGNVGKELWSIIGL